MHYQAPIPEEAGENTVQVSQSEADLTRSNWQFFYAMQRESPKPGSDRRDDAQTDKEKSGHESKDRP